MKSFILTVALLHLSICLKGILQLNTTTLTKAKVEFPNLIVYFYREDCEFCTQFSRIFRIVASKYLLANDHQNIQFAQISFDDVAARDSFREFDIKSIPDLRAFTNGIASNARYQSLSYDQMNVILLETWIDRVANPGNFRRIVNLYLDTKDKLNCLNQKCERIVVKCSDLSLIDTLISERLYYNLLDVSFACLQSDRISSNQIFFENIHTKISHEDCMIKNRDGNEISEECNNFILNMRRSKVEHWKYDHLQEIYAHNRTVFVLLVGNETNSRHMLKQFIRIKQKWNDQKKIESSLLPIFAVGDKDYDMQEVLRLKKFIGGYKSDGISYPFPLLACLKIYEGNLIKILYQSRYPDYKPSKITMEEWIGNMTTNKKTQFYYRNQEYKHNEGQDKKRADLEQLYASIKQQRILLINLYELLYVLNFQKGGLDLQNKQDNRYMFILYSCKTSHDMVALISQTKKWRQDINLDHYFYYIDYFENDAPPGVTINKFPAILVYQKGKLVSQSEGIVDLQEIKKVVSSTIGEKK